MSLLHKQAVTNDPTPDDTYWREKCETEFGLRPDPAERNRYYAGYWKRCYEDWSTQAQAAAETEG